ncbi:hypothetical protein SARC_00095 [Sphaeroforma arctica JP610]|uniref:RING-type domain-containing protein n=1 Tax=Sphaeroforma arctica JP610 TaxID=667725 RepID=A0A0L0GHL4_9EUKA|nr:hypothetical protein SARC_00095 [Sphaeroforma arctica JP610]KNC87838.1 hypothetical protein SARC_00095 [Sphaeroforma arctica JP610]|eukprot:XP_014161740.1 hypothetical protein SARC_00095 [Sphaeroforma arctica JP610]
MPVVECTICCMDSTDMPDTPFVRCPFCLLHECSLCMVRNAATSSKSGPTCMSCNERYTTAMTRGLPEPVRAKYSAWGDRFLLQLDEPNRNAEPLVNVATIIRGAVHDMGVAPQLARGLVKKRRSEMDTTDMCVAAMGPKAVPVAWKNGKFDLALVPVKVILKYINALLRENVVEAEPDAQPVKKALVGCGTPRCRGKLGESGLCVDCRKGYCPCCMKDLGVEGASSYSAEMRMINLNALAMELLDSHVCDRDELATVTHLRSTTTACPNRNCGALINKVAGCDQMFCTMQDCRTLFSYATGKRITSGFVHNPHYAEYLRKGGARIVLGGDGDVDVEQGLGGGGGGGAALDGECMGFGEASERVIRDPGNPVIEKFVLYLVQVRDMDLPKLRDYESRVSPQNTVRFLCHHLGEVANTRMLRTTSDKMAVAACLYTAVLQYTDVGVALLLELSEKRATAAESRAAIDKLTKMVAQTTMSAIESLTGRRVPVTVEPGKMVLPLAGIVMSRVDMGL